MIKHTLLLTLSLSLLTITHSTDSNETPRRSNFVFLPIFLGSLAGYFALFYLVKRLCCRNGVRSETKDQAMNEQEHGFPPNKMYKGCSIQLEPPASLSTAQHISQPDQVPSHPPEHILLLNNN